VENHGKNPGNPIGISQINVENRVGSWKTIGEKPLFFTSFLELQEGIRYEL